jgi:hypothetical protein
MSGPLADFRAAVLARFASDPSVLALVPQKRHFADIPRHVADAWLALGEAKVLDHGSSHSAGHRIEMQVIIGARPKQSDVTSAIADRLAVAAAAIEGPFGGIHVIDVHAQAQSFAPTAEPDQTRAQLLLVALTEPL